MLHITGNAVMCSKRGERKSGRKTPRKGDLDFIPAPDSELTLMDDYQHDETVTVDATLKSRLAVACSRPGWWVSFRFKSYINVAEISIPILYKGFVELSCIKQFL